MGKAQGAPVKQQEEVAPVPLDRLSPVFVPEWLIRVNVQTPAAIIHRSVAELGVVDLDAWGEDLFPSGLARRFEEERQENKRLISESWPSNAVQVRVPFSTPAVPTKAVTILPPAKRKVPAVQRRVLPDPRLFAFPEKLSPKEYAKRQMPLLRLEYEARNIQLQLAALFSTPITLNVPPDATDMLPMLYTFAAKSIREGWPPVDLGDVLIMRQLRPWQSTWQGLAFVASVWGINRAKGELVIRCDSLRGDMIESLLFNIVWLAQDKKFYAMTDGCEFLQADLDRPHLVDDTPVRSTSELLLFPEAADAQNDFRGLSDEEIDVANDLLTEQVENFEWVNKTLNDEQREAVLSIALGNSRIPFLISGPPGTGKTSVLCEAVLQILRLYPKTHILLCGGSDPSADTLATRLTAHLTPNQLFRLNSPARPFTEVRGELLPFCFSEEERFALPPVPVLLSKQVIVSSCLDASILLYARITNSHISRLESTMAKNLRPNEPQPLLTPHFAYFLLDEAAQVFELETNIPLAVIITDPAICHHATVSLCGDIHQLGPVVVSAECRSREMDLSLLERLSERPVYRDHPYSRKNRRRNPGLQWSLGIPFSDLTKNYRSHPAILMLPSTLFYSESLEPFAPTSVQKSPLRQWARLPTTEFPVLFLGIDGVDEPQDEGASYYNLEEIAMVVSLIENLVTGRTSVKVEHGHLRAKEISVISPFREQVWRIRLALRAVGLSDVDVGNVEALQGMENRVVIISTVRSNKRFLAADREKGHGLIGEPKRFNVAMTRAKELLIVVGNAQTLVVDENWRSFYHFTKRNGSYVGPAIECEGADNISRLEVQFRATRMEDAAGDDDESAKEKARDAAFDVLVGSVARETLLDDK